MCRHGVFLLMPYAVHEPHTGIMLWANGGGFSNLAAFGPNVRRSRSSAPADRPPASGRGDVEIVMATKPATAVAWQTAPTAVGRPPSATGGRPRPQALIVLSGTAVPVVSRSRCLSRTARLQSQVRDHNLVAHPQGHVALTGYPLLHYSTGVER